MPYPPFGGSGGTGPAGPQGPMGPQGPAGGSITLASDVQDNDLLAYDATNTEFQRAPARMENENLILSAPRNEMEADSMSMSPGTSMGFSSSFPFYQIDQFPGLQFTPPDAANRRDGDSFEMRYLHFTEAENDLQIQNETGTTLSFPITFTYTATINSRINALKFQVGTAVTNLRAEIRYSGGENALILQWPSREAWETGVGGQDFAPGEMTVDLEGQELRLFFDQPGGPNVISVEIRADSGTLLGNASNIPAFTGVVQRGEFRRLLTAEDPVAVESIQDIVATMFTGGTHNGITFSYDDTDGFVDANVTGVTPPPSTDPAVSGFSINIPGTVSTGFNFNEAKQITFTTQETSDITALTLVVTGGDDITLTVPGMDGSHTQSVTLSGIDSSSAGTVSFQIRGTTSEGQTIMSNTRSITIRAVVPEELAYYDVRPTDDFASAVLTEMENVDVQPPGTTFQITESLPAGHVLGILEPTDRPITSILERTFNVESLSRFTRTSNARTIGGQTYDLLTLTNSGSTGNISFEVTHA